MWLVLISGNFGAIGNVVAGVVGRKRWWCTSGHCAYRFASYKYRCFNRWHWHLACFWLRLSCFDLAFRLHQKRFESLINRKSKKKVARATLLLAGSGEREAELRAQASGLNNLRFLGWRDDLPELFCDEGDDRMR